MKNYLLVFLLLILSLTASAQNYEKVVVNASDTVSGYYLAVKPTGKINGVLFLLDGFGGSPESIFPESMLPNTAYANGFLTIAAAMGPKIYADSAVIGKLNLILQDVITRYGVARNKFVMGGFSAGGTISLRYVELCRESPVRYPVIPRAVFTVDSPVDLIDLWGFFEKQIEKNYSDVAVNEAKFVSGIMKTEHGTPQADPDVYKWLTPFNVALKTPGNEQYLKDIPVRVYHDVDVAWQLQNRRRSVYEANFLNSSEMILRLVMLKNPSAEFIQGRTGYRSNGMRHPHSWNIVDEVAFIQWMKKVLEK